eukprot:120550-Lingulodinium_polyedra.AAC.1
MSVAPFSVYGHSRFNMGQFRSSVKRGLRRSTAPRPALCIVVSFPGGGGADGGPASMSALSPARAK